jgi:hypothetical protein
MTNSEQKTLETRLCRAKELKRAHDDLLRDIADLKANIKEQLSMKNGYLMINGLTLRLGVPHERIVGMIVDYLASEAQKVRAEYEKL